jgi:hypothetical protein
LIAGVSIVWPSPVAPDAFTLKTGNSFRCGAEESAGRDTTHSARAIAKRTIDAAWFLGFIGRTV